MKRLKVISLNFMCIHLQFRHAFQICRQETLNLVADTEPSLLNRQAHPAFSPIVWHLGHIAYTESLWMLERLACQPCYFPQYKRLFSADGLPKAARENVPELSTVLSYLSEIRDRTLSYLDETSFFTQSRLWYWLLQHESQHVETIAIVRALHAPRIITKPLEANLICSQEARAANKIIHIGAGNFVQGSDSVMALDNERGVHSVRLDDYWIDHSPVTCGQYRQFIEADGYQQAQWWTAAGWQWQKEAKTKAPLYWIEDRAFDQHPVCGVSWYEADAYARFIGKRLPTESEWAKAAYQSMAGSMLGRVWEWTDTWFSPYPGFRAFPYVGYSQTYFDRAHRVLRGGSWATPTWALRRSFRNWYHPHRREMFAGFRCASS